MRFWTPLPSPRRSFVTGTTFAWDWHTYSLLLFGVLMVWIGVQCLRLALRMGRGDASARLGFLRLAGLVLLIMVPIVAIQPLFRVAASELSVIVLLVVGVGGRALAAARPSELHAASVGA